MIAFSSILVALSGASPDTAAIFRCVLALPVLIPIAFWEDRRFGSRRWSERRYALAAGVLLAVDLVFWHRAIGDIGAGIATMLANVQLLLIPFIAWIAWKERPGRPVLLAAPVALVGIVLLSGVLGSVAFGEDPARGTVYALLAGVAYVGFLLLLRRGGIDLRRPAGPLLDATLVTAVVCLLTGAAIGDADVTPSWSSFAWLVLLAISSQVLGWLLITTSLPRLPAAVGSMILSVQPACTIAFAGVILGEDPSALQLLGIVLVMAAVLAAAFTGTRQDDVAPTAAAPELDGAFSGACEAS
jgi:drug/metabolite transporter (DMT)-like permease